MTGIRYITVSVVLVLIAAYVALDFSELDFSWLTFLSFENMCTDPELREYVFKPFTCDKYLRGGIIDVTGGTSIGTDELLLELDATGNLIQISE